MGDGRWACRKEVMWLGGGGVVRLSNVENWTAMTVGNGKIAVWNCAQHDNFGEMFLDKSFSIHDINW